MEEFDRNQRARAFDKIPRPLRTFIMSDESIAIFQDMGKLHGLNIEKTGVLADIITLTLIGLLPPAQFTSTVQEKLQIDNSKAIAISGTAEKSVFLKVRAILQKETSPVPENTLATTNPSREEMLAEIENPTPVQHPISSAPQTQTSTATAHEFIAAKMAEPASMPTQKYTTDPYRESLS
jgi:hypothetical protein